MSDSAAPPDGGVTRPGQQPEVQDTYLAPAADFPADLGQLSVVDLHVLHSRICRQLDREYASDPAGAHPLTLDRHRELVLEFEAREILAASPGRYF